MKRFLRALACTSLLGIAAAAAQAQVAFVRVHAPFRAAVVVAVPPCPGVGYVWTPGYYAGAVWVPGIWAYRGYDRGYVVRDYRHDYRFAPRGYRR
jgi:WXXGXW repeat (2 copies)